MSLRSEANSQSAHCVTTIHPKRAHSRMQTGFRFSLTRFKPAFKIDSVEVRLFRVQIAAHQLRTAHEQLARLAAHQSFSCLDVNDLK